MSYNKEFFDVQAYVEFTKAQTLQELTSRENIALSLGKIARYYNNLVRSDLDIKVNGTLKNYYRPLNTSDNQIDFRAGTNISLTYDDTNNSITINSTGGSSVSYTTSATGTTLGTITSGTDSYDVKHMKLLNDALSSNMYKIAVNTDGHVTSGTAVTKSDLTTLLESNGGYYVKKSGDTMTGNLKFGVSSKGIWYKDVRASTEQTEVLYPAIIDNDTNLWIGANKTQATHHTGATYISAGYDLTNSVGNKTIYVSVPNATNTNASNYRVFHAGNLTNGSGISLSTTDGVTSISSNISATTTGSGNAVTSVSYSNGVITATKGSSFALDDHTHGLMHSNFTKRVDNSSTGDWTSIGVDPTSTAGFLLKSIRTQANTPAWLANDFGAGIAFGGADTKGVISMRYQTPEIVFAGGNHSETKTEPTWYMKLTGTSATTYNLDNFSTSDTHVNVTLNTTTRAYLLGTTTTPTGTASAVTSIADTGVYLDTSAGSLHASSISATSVSATGVSATTGSFDTINNQQLQLWNSISSGTYSISLQPASGISSNRTITFPDKSGTVALTSDIPSYGTVGDTYTPVYFNAGQPTAITVLNDDGGWIPYVAGTDGVKRLITANTLANWNGRVGGGSYGNDAKLCYFGCADLSSGFGTAVTNMDGFIFSSNSLMSGSSTKFTGVQFGDSRPDYRKFQIVSPGGSTGHMFYRTSTKDSPSADTDFTIWRTFMNPESIVGGDGITVAVDPHQTVTYGTTTIATGLTISHSNSVTAKTVYTPYVKYDSSGHVTASSHWSHTAYGTNGESGWIRVATITHLKANDNTPFMLLVSQRGNTLNYKLHIRFNNASTVEHSLDKFLLIYDSDDMSETISPKAYLKQVDTATWYLYIKKCSSYEQIAINFYPGGYYALNYASWVWNDIQTAASDITGGTESTTVTYVPYSSLGTLVTASRVYALGTNIGKVTIDGNDTIFIVPQASSSDFGTVKVSDSYSSSAGTASSSVAASSYAVNQVYQLANGKSSVSVSQTQTSGTQIASITVDGSTTKIYTPTVSKYSATSDGAYIGYITANGSTSYLYNGINVKSETYSNVSRWSWKMFGSSSNKRYYHRESTTGFTTIIAVTITDNTGFGGWMPIPTISGTQIQINIAATGSLSGPPSFASNSSITVQIVGW